MAATAVFWHPDIFLHDAHAQHCVMASDRIARVAAAVQAVPGMQAVLAIEAPVSALERVHHPDYLAYLAESATLPEGKVLELDGETALNRHTWRAQLLSAGAMCQAIEAVRAGQVRQAFNAVYAGHHAEHVSASGFCFVNMMAVGAFHARTCGYQRIAVLDFDTHSGNGTVLALLRHPEFFFAETYQPGYPGAFLRRTPRPGHIRRKKCTSRREVMQAWGRFLEELVEFAPDLVLVSAGFDAHAADPLGTPSLLDEDYVTLARGILAAGAPVIATLEGGYSVPDTARCAALFVRELVAHSE